MTYVPNSSTAGYLAPAAPPPTEDDDLARFLQSVVANITGLDGSLVRPRWQNPDPGRPQRNVTWCGMGLTGRQNEGMPVITHSDAGDTLLRYERLTLDCTFYGPSSELTAGYLRDGLYVAQNRDVLYAAGIALVTVGNFSHAPELVNDGWLSRTDLTVTLRREVRRVYPILSIVSAQAGLLVPASGGLITDSIASS